jgi:hypothetical protein
MKSVLLLTVLSLLHTSKNYKSMKQQKTYNNTKLLKFSINSAKQLLAATFD